MKPPYRVLSMAEIAAIPPNGLTHASTFSGCGGTCLGFRMAGFKTAWANDSDASAQQSYRANFPTTYLDTRNICDIQPHDILAATGLKVGELDVFEGSPPCTAFSTAGRGATEWGRERKHRREHSGATDTKVEVEELSFEFVRLLGGLMPRAFVVENVPAMAQGHNKAYLHETRRQMEALSYRLETAILNAYAFGVPQNRRRLFIVGVHPSAPTYSLFPSPDQAVRYGLSDAVPGATHVEGYEFYETRLQSAERPMPTVMTGAKLKIGVDGVVRYPTVDELKRICSFPDDFALLGTVTEQRRRLGNAVPPFLAKAIATSLRKVLAS